MTLTRVMDILDELWRTNRRGCILILGGLLVNISLLLLLHAVMLPGLEKDQATLIQRQAAQRALAVEKPGQALSDASDPLEQFYRQVADYESFPEFLKQLYLYSRDSGLNIERIAYRPEKTDLRTVLRYQLDFSVTGQYLQIKKFIQALENWSQLVVVEQVKLTGQKPERDEVVLSIRLAAYFDTVES